MILLLNGAVVARRFHKSVLRDHVAFFFESNHEKSGESGGKKKPAELQQTELTAMPLRKAQNQ